MRIAVACAAALLGAIIVSFQYEAGPHVHTDFGMVWFGARAVLEGRDPYTLIGPGLEFDYRWRLLYPMPSLVAIMPLAMLSERLAATLFVSFSAGLLAFGMTRNGWHLVPLLATEAFVSACRMGQWSPILTAALFLPVVGALSIVKPQTALPILLASRSGVMWVAGLAGSAVLLAASFMAQPHWVSSWLRTVTQANTLSAPVTHFGGPLILLVLIRWRRPESWLIATLACVPQSVGWYGTLPLLTVPATMVESIVLAGTSALGAYVGGFLLPETDSLARVFDWTGGLIVLTVYLPAVVMVLRRPNNSEPPVWLAFALERSRSISGRKR